MRNGNSVESTYLTLKLNILICVIVLLHSNNHVQVHQNVVLALKKVILPYLFPPSYDVTIMPTVEFLESYF